MFKSLIWRDRAPCSENRFLSGEASSPRKRVPYISPWDYIRLDDGQRFTHEPIDSEAIYVLKDGCAEVTGDSKETQTLQPHDVLFLPPGDTFSLAHTGDEPTTIITCWAVTTAR